MRTAFRCRGSLVITGLRRFASWSKVGKIHSSALAPAGVIVIQNLDILYGGDGKPIIGIDSTLEEWLWVLHINIQGKLKGNFF